ncbi:MAG: ABC transporter ATP-binding protein [Pseudomonadota bacterium]
MTAPAQAAPAIALSDVAKSFGSTVAVDSLSFEARAGSCLGLLGPNGAGKSTAINMMVGLEAPDRGRLEVLGRSWQRDARTLRAAIGVQLQETQLFEKLSVRELLSLFRSFYPNGYAPQAIIELIGLEAKADTHCRALSGGQRQRLALGCALVGKPRILFLDEPTTGLDPQSRRRVWEVVEQVRADGGTIILTTHYMDEAQRLCDDLVIVDRGRAIAKGAPAELIDRLAGNSVMEVTLAKGLEFLALEEVASLPGIAAAEAVAGRLRLQVASMELALPALLEYLRSQGRSAVALETRQATLEDVFVQLTGRQLRDG